MTRSFAIFSFLSIALSLLGGCVEQGEPGSQVADGSGIRMSELAAGSTGLDLVLTSGGTPSREILEVIGQ